MKKSCLLLSIAVLVIFQSTVRAQFTYSVTTLTAQTYTPLASGIKLNAGVWTEDSIYTVPTGFTYQMGPATSNLLNLIAASFATPALTTSESGFGITTAMLEDRGRAGMISRSPIRAATTGSTGSRIFKLEIANAGFTTERTKYATSQDSASFQIWIYETSNVVEMRFGPSKVSHFSDYFGPNMICGYVQDLTRTSVGRIYTLNGSPNAPVIDSSLSSPFPALVGLISFPPNGTVYRFTPKGSSTGIGAEHIAGWTSVFPTECSNRINIICKSSASYAICSINGSNVLRGVLEAGHNRLNLESLLPGIYVIRLTGNDGQFYTGRLIKR